MDGALPNQTLFHASAMLGLLLLAGGFAWGAWSRRKIRREAHAAVFWSVALFVSALAHALFMADKTSGSGLLYGAVLAYTLEPALLYAGFRVLSGRGGIGKLIPIVAGLAIGWGAAAIVADMPWVWILGPVYVLRSLMLVMLGAMVWSLANREQGKALSVDQVAALMLIVNGLLAMAVVGLDVMGTDPKRVLPLVVFDLGLFAALGFVMLVRVFGGPCALNRGHMSSSWSRDVLQILGVGALDVDADGTVLWANRFAADLFGVEELQSLCGEPLSRFIPTLVESQATRQTGKEVNLGLALGEERCFEAKDSRGNSLSICVTPIALDQTPGCRRLISASMQTDLVGGLGTERMLVAVRAPESLLERDAVSLMALAHLFQDMNRLVRTGQSQQALCRVACAALAQLADAPMVWVVLGSERASMTLVAVAGDDAADLSDQIGQPLSPVLRSIIAPALDLGTPHILAKGQGDLEGLDLRPPASGADGGITVMPSPNIGPDSAPATQRSGSVLVIPMVCRASMIGALAVYGRTRVPDRLVRLRAEAVAQHIVTTSEAIQDMSFLRLQAQAMAVAANATMITDSHGLIVWVNEAFATLSGFTAADVQGRSPDMLTSGQQDPSTQEDMWATVKDGRPWDGELVQRRKGGTLYTVRQSVTPICGEDGTISHYVFVHEDITDHKRAEERVRYLSNYDTLTRLPNRTLFRDRLHQAVQQARRTDGAVAVLFVDLAQFSRVNDTMGHDVGDQILMTIGSRLNAAVADEVDTVARMGGDEFALIQTGRSGADTVAGLARRVARIIETPVEVGQQAISVRASVGIAMYPDDGPDPDSLIKNADLAMHRVIRLEGETYRFFSNEMNDDAQARLALEADLRRALERQELVNYYQPQYDMSGTLVGMEALVRWEHPVRGLISPSSFIPVAEESGLILALGDLVLRRALADVASWQAEGLPLVPVAVNLSAPQFAQADLVEHIQAALHHHGLPSQALEIELTESMLMREADQAIRLLEKLSDLGIHLAIDDFGTGYSSLAYLKRFPVQKLKIDQSFVRHVNDDTNDAIIVRAIINLGHSLGLTVLAEGVETEDQFDYLRKEGADVVQGYLFSKPIDYAAMEHTLRVEFGRLPVDSVHAVP